MKKKNELEIKEPWTRNPLYTDDDTIIACNINLDRGGVEATISDKSLAKLKAEAKAKEKASGANTKKAKGTTKKKSKHKSKKSKSKHHKSKKH